MIRELQGWRLLLARVGYPGFLLFAMGLVLAVHQLGVALPLATGIAVLFTTLLALFLERVATETSAWAAPPAPTWLSWAQTHLFAPLSRGAFFTVLTTVVPWISAEYGASLWPSQLPLVFQVVLALLIADLGAYAAHRWMHLSRLGWRIHVVHHSPSKLHMTAEGSSHPFNASLTMFSELAPLILLGVTPEAFALWSAYMALNGLLQHSNIAFRPGLTNFLVATSEVHRYHHSIDRRESNTNFGNSTVIWDLVFGTFSWPKGRRQLPRLGLTGIHIPNDFWLRLATPFLLERMRRDEPS